MSFFDQPYYALTKSHMCRMGIWPEQSKLLRVIRPLTVFILTLTLFVPRLIRLNDVFRKIDALVHDIPHVLVGIGTLLTVLRYIQNYDKIKLSFTMIERHWHTFRSTSAVIVLDKYAERGRSIIIVYSICVYLALFLYWVMCLSPVILDLVHPLNETRPKINFCATEHGFDKEKYYWFILAHEYVVTLMVIAMVVAMETMYFLWAVHACALFEIVRFNLKLVTSKHPNYQENGTSDDDFNYKQICDCITAHKEAISFADLMESICSGPFGVVISFIAIIIIFAGVEALINVHHPYVFFQFITYTIIQVFHLYMNSIPGQELINHSQQIHTTVYDVEWQDMSVKAQKLLIPMLIRSSKPCRLTARKVYVISLEGFGSTIRTVISYFTILAQMM